ncbi:MAG TPA: hypothetical protein VGQ57_10730 [Polyangiaceae bacterium]|jgi:hypothetical protein|nr:hypothetical protein [Polyangiaceae bacterium]
MVHSRGRDQHFENAGHLDPERAERLLAGTRARRSKPPESAFVIHSSADDGFAAELGEGVVVAMTSGEDRLADDLNHDVDEDWGGPFVFTTASKEFAHGTDESNIAEATREPFPTT